MKVRKKLFFKGVLTATPIVSFMPKHTLNTAPTPPPITVVKEKPLLQETRSITDVKNEPIPQKVNELAPTFTKLNSRNKLINLRDIVSKVENNINTQTEKIVLTQELLNDYINDYIEYHRIETQNISECDAFKQINFLLQNSNEIVVQANTSFVFTIISSLETQIKSFISKKTNSEDIKMRIELNATTNKNAPVYMTSNEVYQKLKIINPHLEEFKNQLQLDIF